MRAQIVIGPDGKVAIAVKEGTYEEGKQKLMALMTDLKASGIVFEEEGTVEQHKHDTVHVHNATHNHVS